jgi:3-phenylpropionate/trans-cinnamate dioxygenase ferredoxin component
VDGFPIAAPAVGGTSVYTPLADLADVPPGRLLSVCTPDGVQVVLVNVAGEICALRDECPHQQYALSAGELLADGTIECVWHGARFDCRTGAVRNPPAVDDVQTYAVRVENDRICVGPARALP